ncbi:MAG: DUF4912 domain-containing protein [Clostridia bacterium]|nr:DUF4912 domain-containing protein [Clostridia bacterium]
MANEEVKKEKTDVSKVSKNSKKVAVEKASSTKKTTAVSKKETIKKDVSKTTKSTAKKVEKVSKASVKTDDLKESSKKPTSTKTSAKKSTSSKSEKTVTKKKTTSTANKISSRAKIINEPIAKSMLPEYYDLPYRYNQTIVKILAQTPTTLFVYWDISDEDRKSLNDKYGENFFYESRPILVVHNTTHNYTFEIEINDFANSWYIRTQEPNCDYVIELGRKFYNNSQEYIYINSSNGIVSPNDHILFENSNLGNVLFRNVKTNKLSSKDFGSLRFINYIDKLYGNIYDVYSALYNNDILNDLSNPSSGEFRLERHG